MSRKSTSIKRSPNLTNRSSSVKSNLKNRSLSELGFVNKNTFINDFKKFEKRCLNIRYLQNDLKNVQGRDYFINNNIKAQNISFLSKYHKNDNIKDVVLELKDILDKDFKIYMYYFLDKEDYCYNSKNDTTDTFMNEILSTEVMSNYVVLFEDDIMTCKGEVINVIYGFKDNIYYKIVILFIINNRELIITNFDVYFLDRKGLFNKILNHDRKILYQSNEMIKKKYYGMIDSIYLTTRHNVEFITDETIDNLIKSIDKKDILIDKLDISENIKNEDLFIDNFLNKNFIIEAKPVFGIFYKSPKYRVRVFFNNFIFNPGVNNANCKKIDVYNYIITIIFNGVFYLKNKRKNSKDISYNISIVYEIRFFKDNRKDVTVYYSNDAEKLYRAFF